MKLLTLSAVAFSLFLTACSSNAGSPSAGDPTPTSTQTGEKRTILVPNLPTIGNVSTAEDIEKLLQLIATDTATLDPGVCTNRTSSRCSSTSPVGTILGSYKQSYSNYVAIRNEYLDDSGTRIENTPANNFVALVTLPTTNKNAVVDATYKGRVSYTAQNQLAVSTNTNLVMTVKDNQISGVVTSTTGTGVTHNVLDFESAPITASTDRISFEGKVKFNLRDTADIDYQNSVEGTYQGLFAGENAEEVIGTFHSNNTTSRTSIQGAFGAKK